MSAVRSKRLFASALEHPLKSLCLSLPRLLGSILLPVLLALTISGCEPERRDDSPAPNTDATIDAEAVEGRRMPVATRPIERVSSLPPEFDLSAPSEIYGQPNAVRTATLVIAQSRPARRAGLELTASLPAGLRIERAELVSDGEQLALPRCVLTDSLRCEMPDVAWVDTLRLEFDYLVLEPVTGALAWTLSSDNGDDDEDAATWSSATSVRISESMDRVQAIIDAASDGDTLELPAGIFEGTLDARGLEIDVRGASGAADASRQDRTVFLSTDPAQPLLVNTGPRNTWSNIVWQTTGAPLAADFGKNLTIADSVVRPVPGLAHRVDGLFDGKPASSYRLHASRVTGFGQGRDGDCIALVKPESARLGYLTQVYLQHNRFIGNECDALVDVELEAGAFGNSAYLFVDGNTFVDNPHLFSISGSAPAFAKVRIANNIASGVDSLLDISGDVFTDTRADPGSDSNFNSKSGAQTEVEAESLVASLVTSRNLVWNSEQSAFVDRGSLTRPGVSVALADLTADPLFNDAAAGDYGLSADSPAIDAGVEPTPYVWTWEDYKRDLQQPGPEDVDEPLDGDADGEPEPDIGAFEFDPSTDPHQGRQPISR